MKTGIISDADGRRRLVELDSVQLDTLRAEQAPTIAHVRAERDRRRYPGRLATPLGFDADLRNARDGENLHGLGSVGMALLMTGDTAAAVWFRCADNIDRTVSPTEAVALGRRYGAYLSAVAQAKGVVEAKLLAGRITTHEQIRTAAEWPDPIAVPAP